MNETPITQQLFEFRRSKNFRAAIVGTGYIADFHARAIRDLEGVELTSICDSNLRRAQSFATNWGVSETFGSLQSMLEKHAFDSVHVLVPPDLHYSLARAALQSGAHVFLEKPMCTSVDEADDLLNLARDKGLRLGVNHNMLFGSYERLRTILHSGILGPMQHVDLRWFSELPTIRFGPFDSWMLRSPGNPFMEIGPHLVSALLDLVGTPNDLRVFADREAALPSGGRVFRRWRVHASIGSVAADININLGPTFSLKTVCVHCLFGSVTADLEANTCIVDQQTSFGSDLDRYARSRSLARQIRSDSGRMLRNYALSKLKLKRGGNPYQHTFLDSVAAFYTALRADARLDKRIDGDFGRAVIECCSNIIDAAQIAPAGATHSRKPKTGGTAQPTILVLGGSGFIGRELISQLLNAGYSVRAMTRGTSPMLEELSSNRLEIVRGDIRNRAELDSAVKGVEFVYHLATAEGKTWDDYICNEVEPTRLVGEVCLAAAVKRLIYTGTIASYYTGSRAGTITETTALARDSAGRNYYARAKAASEAILLQLHHAKKLPVVIFRPGIVIGKGGNPFHWGVGRFSANVCEVWGEGKHKLPFVLVTDVATALVRGIQAEGIEGRSYNLVDVPLISARDYLQELQYRAAIKLNVKYRPIWYFYLSDLAKWTVKLAVGHPDRIRVPSYFDWEARTQHAFFDCKRARIDLGWTPASERQRLIDEGVGGSLQSWLAAVG